MDQGRSAVETIDRSLRWPALAMAVLVQLVLLALIRSDPHPPKPPGPPPLQVVWIEQRAMSPLPPMPTPPARAPASREPPSAPPVADRPRRPAPRPADDARPIAAEAPPLFDSDRRPRLPDAAADDYIDLQQQSGDARAIGRRRDTLPGSDVAVVDVGRLRRQRSPEDVVLGVAQMLFGAPQRDSCDRIERRIMNEDDALVRDIDLAKWRRLCRGSGR